LSSGWATSLISLFFPGVKERFDKSAEWHREQYGIKPLYGLFWNLCINASFPRKQDGKRPRVHAIPHADWKNGIAICLLLIYVLPGRMCYELWMVTFMLTNSNQMNSTTLKSHGW
jgi:hypothetical protein